MATRMTLQVAGLENLIADLRRLNGSIEETAKEALIESQSYVAEHLKTDMEKHKRTGHTADAIVDSGIVESAQGKLSIDVGFRLSNGGWASIFLMYGTPRMQKDTKLYNDVYGTETQKRIAELQTNIFNNAIRGLR